MPLALLCCLTLLCAGPQGDDRPSYLTPCEGTSHCQRYVPQPGDLVFFDKPNRFWDFLDWLAGTKPPDHLGMVVAMPDGSMAVFEAGPDAHFHVYITDTYSRFSGYRGRVYVRRLRCPLTAAQSSALTNFAIQQEGKRYAVLRLVRQITPFRTRGPVRTKLFATTIIDRRRWICSDAIITAGTVAGLFDARRMPASAIYARDVMDDDAYDLSCLYEPVARWSSCPIEPEMAANFARLRTMFTKPPW